MTTNDHTRNNPMKEGTTLRQFIKSLKEMARDESLGLELEVCALSDKDEPYTPVISIFTDREGIHRIYVA